MNSVGKWRRYLKTSAQSKKEAGKTLHHLLNSRKLTITTVHLRVFFFSSMTAFKKCFHSMKRKAHRSVTGIFPCWQSKGRKATDRRNTSGLLSSFQLRPSPQPILFSGTENGINYNNKHSILQGIITEGSNFSCAHQL